MKIIPKKNASIWLIVVAAGLISLLIRYCTPPIGNTVLLPLGNNLSRSLDNTAPPPSHVVASKDGAMAAFLDAFKTPIEIHGKVVDQHGDPVSGATVKLFPIDSPHGEESKSKLLLISDTEGFFSAKNLKGFSLGIQVSKEGYMYLSPLGAATSDAMIDYANGAEAGKRYSNPATPLILTLQKIGQIEPMFYTDPTRWLLPIDGKVRSIALDSKKGVGQHQIEFRFKSDWGQLPNNNTIYSKQFDWSFEARIPGGGFIWNDNDVNFDAPETGYKESIRYDFLAIQPREKWKRLQHGRYFVKFADGSHGRIRFSIDGACNVEEAALYMTSWLNLKPGSRNLASPENDGAGFHGGNPSEE